MSHRGQHWHVFLATLCVSASLAGSHLPEKWNKLKEEIPDLNAVHVSSFTKMADLKADTLAVSVALHSKAIEMKVQEKLVYTSSAQTSSAFHVIALRPDDGHVTMKRQFRTGELAEGELLATALASLQPATLLVLIAINEGPHILGATEQFLLTQLGLGWWDGRKDNGTVQHRVGEKGRRGKLLSPIGMLERATQATELPAVRRGTGSDLANFSIKCDLPAAILVSRVPDGWPPRTEKDGFRTRVLAEAKIRSSASGLRNASFAARVPKAKRPACGWHLDDTRQEQVRFCRLYEGYGALCRCNNPIEPARLRHAAVSIELKEVIPIAILTANRPFFLYRLLQNLLAIPGANQTPIHVMVDGHNQETLALAKLFRLPVSIHHHQGSHLDYGAVNSHLKFGLHSIFNQLPTASKAIILEDDLIVSPDFIRYFQQTAFLLDADPSIFCVNSFSLNSYPEVARDATRLRRSDLYPQYGWMVSRGWAEEMVPLWISSKAGLSDWDWWLFGNARMKGRHAIVPEVSRTHHSGSSGAHIDGWDQALVFGPMIYNKDPWIELKDLHLLTKEAYDEFILKEIKSATRLPKSFNPCNLKTIPKNLPPGPLVFAILGKSLDDENSTIITAARCLHAYPRTIFDNHKGVFQYTIRGNRALYMVACPVSPYCSELTDLKNILSFQNAVKKVEEYDERRRFKSVIRNMMKINLPINYQN